MAKPRFPNNKGSLNKKETKKVVEQARNILQGMFINADVFEYVAEPDEIINESEILTVWIGVKFNGRYYYQFSPVYVDDDMSFLQYEVSIG